MNLLIRDKMSLRKYYNTEIDLCATPDTFDLLL